MILSMGTHVSFIFRGYDQYIEGLKPSFLMVLGSKGREYTNTHRIRCECYIWVHRLKVISPPDIQGETHPPGIPHISNHYPGRDSRLKENVGQRRDEYC